MSDRDVIAETIAAHALYYDEFGPHIHVCACGWHVPDELEEEYLDGNVEKFTLAHAAHVAAALRESRTVRTVEELDVLPVGTVILASGYTYELEEPALVLWRPEDGAL